MPIITILEPNMFPQTWLSQPVNARASRLSKSETQRSLEVLKQALGEYPESLLRENIKRIYLLGSLTLYGLPADATISSDSLYIVNRGSEEYTNEYIALIFHSVFSTLVGERNSRASGYEPPNAVRLLPQRRYVEMTSAERLMKLVYKGNQGGGPDFIYALDKTGFVGVTLLKQFKSLPPESAVKCPLRCSEITPSVPALLRATIKDHIFAQHWRIEDSSPVWSNDGKRIAFQSARDNAVAELYVMDLDGRKIRRLTRTEYSPYQSVGFSPAVWSPDDRQLAYVMHPGGPSKLFVVNADGTGQTQLPTSSRTNGGIFLIGWLPDRRILFLIEGTDRSRTIYSILPDGSGLTSLTEKDTVVYEVVLSPNKHLLAIRANAQLTVRDLGTNVPLASAMSTGIGEFSWSPDSRSIAFGNGAGLSIIDVRSNKVRVMDQSSEQRQATERHLLFPPPWDVFHISWSADGKQIAYGVVASIVRNSVNPTELRAVNAAGGGSWRLAVEGSSPVWSPDGRYVIFRRSGARLYLVRADGSDERYLAAGLYARWIP